jgi:hypothetical protein
VADLMEEDGHFLVAFEGNGWRVISGSGGQRRQYGSRDLQRDSRLEKTFWGGQSLGGWLPVVGQ